jgi:hypothetical protein
MVKEQSVVSFSTLLDLTSFLSDEQKSLLVKHLLSKNIHDPSKIFIPISIFNKKISFLEAVAKYLHDNMELNFKVIAETLSREPVTVRTSYNNATKKHPQKLNASNFNPSIPLSILSNRKFSVFEIIAIYLKDEIHLSFNKIAGLLERDYKTIWTTYSRAKKK